MPTSKILLAIKLIKIIGFSILIFVLTLIFLNIKLSGFNIYSIKNSGPLFGLGFFYFLITTIYLKDFRSKFSDIKLDRDVCIGTVLSITFAVLMMFSISLKNI